MIGWFINFEIFQKYKSPSLGSIFPFVVVVVAVVGVIIGIATIAVVVVFVYDNFLSEKGVGE